MVEVLDGDWEAVQRNKLALLPLGLNPLSPGITEGSQEKKTRNQMDPSLIIVVPLLYISLSFASEPKRPGPGVGIAHNSRPLPGLLVRELAFRTAVEGNASESLVLPCLGRQRTGGLCSHREVLEAGEGEGAFFVQ